MICYENYDLIVTIVKRGHSEKILKASKEAGAEGGTILFARGSGVHEKATLMGIPIEPEKEVLFTVIQEELTEKVLEAIIKAGNLETPGQGIVFVLDLKSVAGICHLIDNDKK
jgi:nitrogen regulatory protein P-II 1